MLMFRVPDMSCAHCVDTITKAVQALDKMAIVEADLTDKVVRIQSHVDTVDLVAALDSAGYPAKAA